MYFHFARERKLMKAFENYKSVERIQERTPGKEFEELFAELKCCVINKQKQIIGEMIKAIERMDLKELNSVFSIEVFNDINNMNEDNKLSMENTFLLLKHLVYCKFDINIWSDNFSLSLLRQKFERTIVEEGKKREGKNEKLLVDLCESFCILGASLWGELQMTCISCILKEASNKDESEETRKEVEIALSALSRIDRLHCQKNFM
eukprot:MONOS_5025.1-p1 / transcript=MONOS_5025.1 / gene=MONOS_5025 / organism=Monocercomonoides_exilis_PA203 / gene_product=unspecified product / transcript_product=unspecified product / location=Mono_scaffold00142:2309-3195(+) / protein_length=206 / sequence_SO=supercontig / SO=protein_coding / is_pseudo=false